MNDNQPANLDKQIDQILNNTGCDCYHYTSCEIISNTKIAKAAIQQLLVAERKELHSNVEGVLGMIEDRLAALQSQLTDGESA